MRQKIDALSTEPSKHESPSLVHRFERIVSRYETVKRRLIFEEEVAQKKSNVSDRVVKNNVEKASQRKKSSKLICKKQNPSLNTELKQLLLSSTHLTRAESKKTRLKKSDENQLSHKIKNLDSQNRNSTAQVQKRSRSQRNTMRRTQNQDHSCNELRRSARIMAKTKQRRTA